MLCPVRTVVQRRQLQQQLAGSKHQLRERIFGERQWRTNSVGLTMLRIPAGQVLNEDEQTVEVTEDFLLCDREIGVGMFQQFLDDPNYPTTEKPKDWAGVDTEVSPTAEHPAQQVSWYDAVMFCNWLSGKEGLSTCYKRTGEKDKQKDYMGKETEYDVWRLDTFTNGYRLPTDAEWEYACRAGTTTTFSFGDDAQWLNACAVVYPNDRAERCGAKLPNNWGLFDAHGNVNEWCNDTGGTGGAYRVTRGGSWAQTAWECASSWSVRFMPHDRRFHIGFRVAATPSSQVRKELSGESAQTDQAKAKQ